MNKEKITNNRRPSWPLDNKQFLEHIKVWRSKCEFTEKKKPTPESPKITNYLGECVYLIATNLAKRPNFSNYSYKDEMISDAIENCLLYFGNFDPAKSNSPFSYFTQISYYAFIRRITKEKKQAEIRKKVIMNTGILINMTEQLTQDDTVYDNTILQTLKSYMDTIVVDENQVKEEPVKKKTVVQPKKGLDKILCTNNDKVVGEK